MIYDLLVLVAMELPFLNMGENIEIQMLIRSDIFIKTCSFQSKKFYELGSLRLKQMKEKIKVASHIGLDHVRFY